MPPTPNVELIIICFSSIEIFVPQSINAFKMALSAWVEKTSNPFTVILPAIAAATNKNEERFVNQFLEVPEGDVYVAGQNHFHKTVTQTV